MKQETTKFDAVKALAGYSVVTKSGRRVLNFRANNITKNKEKYPYAGDIDLTYANKRPSTFAANGQFDRSPGDHDLLLVVPSRNERLKLSAIIVSSVKELDELRGMYRQAGVDLGNYMTEGVLNEYKKLAFVVRDNKVWTCNVLSHDYKSKVVYNSLADYVADKPAPKEVQIKISGGVTAKVQKDSVILVGQKFTVSELKTILATAENL